MSGKSACMVQVGEARAKAEKHYDRHHRRWAAGVFAEAIGERTIDASGADVQTTDAADTGRKTVDDAPDFALPLHPPTEEGALADVAAARRWAASWRDEHFAPFVQWAVREWPSVGRQEVPERIDIADHSQIAEFSGKTRHWDRLRGRTEDLADRWIHRWNASCLECDVNGLIDSVQKVADKVAALPDRDWSMLLDVVDWLIDNPNTRLYVRQLPIRGIDSKWLEGHRGAIEPLYSAMTGKDGFSFLAAPNQLRVRFLDPSLAPYGLNDISVVPEEFNTYPMRPKAVIICENRVSVMALPETPQVIAIHGGGYAVGSLSEVGWLLQVPVLYWGDLDSNGFAILNRLRHHIPAALSVMMDRATLGVHRELCVIESRPNRGHFDLLTDEENATLQELLAGDDAVRLEQERIEWDYATKAIKRALADLG